MAVSPILEAMPLEDEVRVVAADYLEANELGLISSFCIYSITFISSMHLERHAFQWPSFLLSAPINDFHKLSSYLRELGLS